MAEEKKTAAQPAAKTTAKQAAKAPTKTIQRITLTIPQIIQPTVRKNDYL